MIEIKNLSKGFNQTKVLENISFKVDKASIYGLVGYNGAGKTTLLKTAAGIYKADKGEVLFDGENTYNNKTVRKRMFYVPDDLYFPSSYSMWKMARFYNDYYPSFNNETFIKLTQAYGLDPNKRISSFSKGMQRQAEIIFALSSSPKYILLDECFDGLDPAKRAMTKKLFVEYMDEAECSFIISSHNLSELSDLCDHVALLNGSELKLNCSVDDVNKNYRKYRLIFNDNMTEEAFKNVNYKKLSCEGKVVTIIISENNGVEKGKLVALEPIAIDEFGLNLEEVFLLEMEENNYDITNIFKETK